MASRPIPFVSTDPKPKRSLEKFKKYINPLLEYLLPHVRPHVQTINKISSLGYPVNCNPGEGLDPVSHVQVWQSKFDVFLEFCEPMMHLDFSAFDDSYHTIGTRKQNEAPSKDRTFQFIDDDGHIYERIISGADRTIQVPQLGAMIGSRTRTITRPDPRNLFLQCWDSMLHNALMTFPLHKTNIYNKEEWPQDAYIKTFDCKHFERYLGMLAIEYAQAIGGVYAEQMLKLIYLSFIVPSDTWRSSFEITPQYGPNVFPQFSSGLACVADLAKLATDTAAIGYFHEVLHMDMFASIDATLSGTSPGLRRWNYGDDNRMMGEQSKVDDFIHYMGDIFDVEVDDTPQYVGAIHRADIRRFVLPRRTYNLKLYQPERDYDWKDYPSLGMVERRNVFTEFGEPEIAAHVIPYENDLWNAIDRPYTTIVGEAVRERVTANKRGVSLTSLQVTDKSYLMTEEEKLHCGQFWHLTPDVTATIANLLVGENVKQHLTFRGAATASLPKPAAALKPYTQDPNIERQSEENELYAIEAND